MTGNNTVNCSTVAETAGCNTYSPVSVPVYFPLKPRGKRVLGQRLQSPRAPVGAALFIKGLGCCQKDRSVLFVEAFLCNGPHYLFGCCHGYNRRCLMYVVSQHSDKR